MAFPWAVNQMQHCSCCVGQGEAWWEPTAREAFAKGTFLLGKFECGLSHKAVDGQTYQVTILEWCLGICREHFQEWMLMGHLLPGKREHSTGGSLLEQHMQLPDLRAQHGYEFVLRGPHTGQPIMLHVSDTAPLQACPLAQIRGVTRTEQQEMKEQNLCRHQPYPHCESSSYTTRKLGWNHTWAPKHDFMSTWAAPGQVQHWMNGIGERAAMIL